MTKTPEELTLDWAAEKLEQDKDYYVETMTGDVFIDFYGQLYDNLHYPQNLGFDNVSNNIIKRILAPVPTYDEYRTMQEKIADSSKKVENLGYLLKECKANLINRHIIIEELGKLENSTRDLLTRINATISESEEK